jgi:hypothetical protein
VLIHFAGERADLAIRELVNGIAEMASSSASRVNAGTALIVWVMNPQTALLNEAKSRRKTSMLSST